MASLVRSGRLRQMSVLNFKKPVQMPIPFLQPACYISSSKKGKDAAVFPEVVKDFPVDVKGKTSQDSTSSKEKDAASFSEVAKAFPVDFEGNPVHDPWWHDRDISRKTYQHSERGWDPSNPYVDAYSSRKLMFWWIAVAFVSTGFLLRYLPDKRMKNWCKTEAYLELARREELGLPLVDPDYIKPENIELPSEEEIGDFPILI